MARIITFGEIMLRLNPEGYLRFQQADRFEASYAGSEANVAVSLANFGMDAAFVSIVPDNALGQCAINALRQYGADTSLMKRSGPRLGVYFVEKGASQRASRVIYDRAGSSIRLADPNDFDWSAIFQGATWFHFSGITPAIGGMLPAICLDALKAAKAAGAMVSCDLNYRKNLWSKVDARNTMSAFMPYIDVCMANEDDAADVFGIRARGSDTIAGKLSHEGYADVAMQIHDLFGCEKVAITLRGSISASENDWAAMLYDSGGAFFSPNYRMHIVDRVGGGDSFAAALIYALIKKYDSQKAVNFAVAASCLKHSIEHDFNLIDLSEVELLASGNASGRVMR